MHLKKKNMFYVDLSELNQWNRFDVVTNTPFEEGAVERLYGVEDHILNYNLIRKLRLGVVKNQYNDECFIYDPTGGNFFNETIKVGIYYQITHPDYDDKELDRWIFGNEEGVDYILNLFPKDGACILSLLNDIFKSKKGKVLEFRAQ
ncbi:hypothetical protein [Oceanobacillus damuensis]|uniref:hypothetical protein n=1 Tax=Oceanobacillus damuensis TaxID=937928 RepID=UPI00082FE88E|nr:hypothetical protein [Oceanobacillus damuensis]